MSPPVIAFHRDCWRLRAERPAAPLARLAEAGDLGPLRDLVRSTAVQPLGSRFSDGSFRPVYAALEPRTCRAEVLHHWTRAFLSAGCPPGAPLRCIQFSLAIHGARFLDVRAGHTELRDPDSYRASQRFGLEAWMAGEDGILYRSVRDPGGACVAAIRPQAGGMPQERSEVYLAWTGERFEDAGRVG